MQLKVLEYFLPAASSRQVVTIKKDQKLSMKCNIICKMNWVVMIYALMFLSEVNGYSSVMSGEVCKDNEDVEKGNNNVN